MSYPSLWGRRCSKPVPFTWAGTGRGAFASRADLGAAAMLTGAGHENQTYELANDTTYSFADIAQLLSDLSGKEVRYVSPTVAEFTAQLTQAGVPAEGIQMAAAFSQAIAQGEFDAPSETLAKLIGRAPESAADFLKAAYKL